MAHGGLRLDGNVRQRRVERIDAFNWDNHRLRQAVHADCDKGIAITFWLCAGHDLADNALIAMERCENVFGGGVTNIFNSKPHPGIWVGHVLRHKRAYAHGVPAPTPSRWPEIDHDVSILE